MGLFQTIQDRIYAAISKLLEPVITPITKLWQAIKGFASALIDIIPETITLVRGTIDEVNAWRSFKQGISFKHGVINLQSVRQHVEDLVTEIVDAWNAVKELFTSGFKLPLKSVNEMAEAAEEVAVAFEDLFGKFGLQKFIAEIVPKLEKAGGKVLEIFAIIEAVAEEALKVVRELQAILNAVRDVRETFQTGKGLFLKQTNLRRVVRLQDGTKMKIRVGNLHS